jgi:hypothetical protein
MENMAQLVKEYNKLTGKSVLRFANKGLAIKALAKARNAALAAIAVIPITILEEHPRNRSLATKATWKNSDVAKARSIRTRVMVQGFGEYASVTKAFHALHIPPQGHIRFRMALKKDGARSIHHNGTNYQFVVVHKKEDPNGQAA